MPRVEHHLPLLSVLQKLEASDRQILVDHLDKESFDTLQFCLKKILQEGKKKKKKSESLTNLVREHHLTFESILGLGSKKKKSFKQKRLALAKIGGNPLALILSSALPLLINLLKK